MFEELLHGAKHHKTAGETATFLDLSRGVPEKRLRSGPEEEEVRTGQGEHSPWVHEPACLFLGLFCLLGACFDMRRDGDFEEPTKPHWID